MDGVPDDECIRFVTKSVEQHAPMAAVKGPAAAGFAAASHRRRRWCPPCRWGEARGWDESRAQVKAGVVDVAQQGCLVEPAVAAVEG